MQLLDSESHIQLLGLVVPDQTVNNQGQNALCQFVKVGHLGIVDLDVEHDYRLGNGLRLFCLFDKLGLGSFLLGGRSSIFGEGIEISIIGSLLLLFFFLLFLLLMLLMVLLAPELNEGGAEGVDELVPVVGVGVGVSIWAF